MISCHWTRRSLGRLLSFEPLITVVGLEYIVISASCLDVIFLTVADPDVIVDLREIIGTVSEEFVKCLE